LGELLYRCIEGVLLHLQVLKVFQMCDDDDLQRSLELSPDLREPQPVLLGPVALRSSEAEPVGSQDPDDPMPESGDVLLDSQSCPYKLASSLLFFVRNGNRCEMPLL